MRSMHQGTLDANESSIEKAKEEQRARSEYIIDGFYRSNWLKAKALRRGLIDYFVDFMRFSRTTLRCLSLVSPFLWCRSSKE